MKKLSLCVLLLALCLVLSACGGGGSPSPSPTRSVGNSSPPPTDTAPPPTPSPTQTPEIKDPGGTTVGTRFAPPQGFTRADVGEGNFAAFLRDLPLKTDGMSVTLYDGSVGTVSAAAVVDIPIGESDRCQRTDALILLRARYLYGAGLKSEIMFHFTSGFSYDYSSYSAGKRVKVSGSDVEWVSGGTALDNETVLGNYLDVLYSYSRASTLESLDTKEAGELYPGVLFTDGNGAIIADMAVNAETGETAVILIGGGSPACDLYIPPNSDAEISPWHIVSPGGGIYIGEASFMAVDAREFN
ncbi:MAG: DUF4846 domain-containing protein [Oscillospiraceae bacterium]|nr:DUF4846 domain-containing protein [Oscillospiraceae bacterium]